jgi:hypothetical protein
MENLYGWPTIAPVMVWCMNDWLATWADVRCLEESVSIDMTCMNIEMDKQKLTSNHQQRLLPKGSPKYFQTQYQNQQSHH